MHAGMGTLAELFHLDETELVKSTFAEYHEVGRKHRVKRKLARRANILSGRNMFERQFEREPSLSAIRRGNSEGAGHDDTPAGAGGRRGRRRNRRRGRAEQKPWWEHPVLVRLLAVVRSTALGRALCEVCAFCFARLKQLWEMTIRPSGHVVNSLVPEMSGNATVDPNCETLSDCGSIESGGDDCGSESGARGSRATTIRKDKGPVRADDVAMLLIGRNEGAVESACGKGGANGASGETVADAHRRALLSDPFSNAGGAKCRLGWGGGNGTNGPAGAISGGGSVPRRGVGFAMDYGRAPSNRRLQGNRSYDLSLSSLEPSAGAVARVLDGVAFSEEKRPPLRHPREGEDTVVPPRDPCSAVSEALGKRLSIPSLPSPRHPYPPPTPGTPTLSPYPITLPYHPTLSPYPITLPYHPTLP